MKTIFNNAPQIKSKSTVHRIILLILSVISASFILAPVLVGFMTNFTRGEYSSIYYIIKSIFALSLIAATALFYVSKKISHMIFPCLFGLITVLFPLLKSIGDYKNIKSIADKFSISQDYTAYLISIGIYLIYAILCILFGLYASGIIKSSVVLLVVCTVSSLATIFIAIDKNVTYNTDIFETLTFASSSVTSLIPIIAITAMQRNHAKKKNSKRTEI